MPGSIRRMIDSIIAQTATGNPALERVIKTKMILKGINPAKFTADSDDDPAILAKLENMRQALSGTANKTTPAKQQNSPVARIQTAFSSKATTAECVKEIQNQIADLNPSTVIFFASAAHTPEAISRQMQEAFPKAQVFGCSSAGEITSGSMLCNSVVAMAFSTEMVPDLKIEIIRNLGQRHDIIQAFGNFEKHFGQSIASMNPSRYVGILLIDGLAGAEENVTETLGDLTNVPFIGGSAGDDLQFTETYVYANGNYYKNAALLALLKPSVCFSFIKTQSFRLLGKTLKVTKANEASREVLEFNGKPAAQAYAEAIGIPVSQITQRFMHNPIGLIVDGEPYVRSPQRLKGDIMTFYCSVKEGMKLSLLASTDMLSDTRNAIAQAEKQLGRISGILNFDCILRTLDLRQKKLSSEYGKIFTDIPTVGFSTYGEQYIGHINQTATMLVFG